MDRVLFATNPPRRCGVYEFGRSTAAALRASRRFEYVYHEFDETTTLEDFYAVIDRVEPVCVLHNWHPSTMPWVSDEVLYQCHRRRPDLRHLAVVHDVPAPFHWMDAAVYLDPTFKPQRGEFVVGRRILDVPEPQNDPGPVIGSFGFALHGKGFKRVIEQVNREFETATIRLHIPTSDYCDANGDRARALIEECRQLSKPGVHLEITTDYLTQEDLIAWLQGNAINCFFYEQLKGRGISSVIDFALAARRPIAITHSQMFRHIYDATPSILIEKSTLKEIMAQGIEPLRPFLDAWTDQSMASTYDSAVDYARSRQIVDLSSNRVLTPRDRERLRPAIHHLTELCPDIMSRKFPEAVFQNAFIFEQARHLLQPNDRVVLVGGYEDPIGPALARLGHDVLITDPQVDGRESSDVLADSILQGVQYDMVISCSVLEHVEEDIDFVQTLFELLKPGGYALLTTDFCDGWRPGLVKPTPDVRLYTLERLRLLASSLIEGAMLDAPGWKAIPPYFHFDQTDYGFCSIAFQRPHECVASLYAPRLMAKKWKAAIGETAIQPASPAWNPNPVQVIAEDEHSPVSEIILPLPAEPPQTLPMVSRKPTFTKKLRNSIRKRRREFKQWLAKHRRAA